MKMVFGVIIGIAGAILLASIVVQASYLSSVIENTVSRFVLAIGGLAMIQIGYTLFKSGRPSGNTKR
ncbi:hypothetical protein [Dehalogenimonas etheniformans]|uniref:Uncharacterized protein n=1 Tax=Dehalogenimonas etheniformans TaxID=1536648 RepID=A0A2P5P591_9CHLR|nr:hypothetical protein [Dehalogenimonas etheniformans]PPD57464.1 hypothetical protein JP09_009045 [Dehalogenimonas etheniformans]QNT76827.1 hypothetical protein HX448_09140 [Dehalogenimonas etheniformans]